MAKFRVKLKYGDPGKYKHDSQTIDVEADSEHSAEQVAVNKFKNSNSTYRNKEVEVIDVKPR